MVISKRLYRCCNGQMTAAVLAMLLASGVAANESLPASGESTVDQLHGLMTERVVLTAEWLDSFFADQNYRAEANTTSSRLSLSSFSQQGDGTDVKAKTKLRLRLPHLENRVMLYISGSGDDLDTTGSIWEQTDEIFSGNDESSLSAGLRRFFREDERINASLGGSVRFRSGSLVGYIEPRLRYFQSYPSFDARFIQRFRWYTDVGLESQTELQLERPVWETWFFRASSRVDWYEDEGGWFPKQGFEWARPIDERRVFSTNWTSYFSTEPQTVLDSSVISARYRQQTWRRWLWFEVAPQVVFAREDDYGPTLGLSLKLEAEFER